MECCLITDWFVRKYCEKRKFWLQTEIVVIIVIFVVFYRSRNAGITYHWNCQPLSQLLIKLVTEFPFFVIKNFLLLITTGILMKTFLLYRLTTEFSQQLCTLLIQFTVEFTVSIHGSQSPPISHTIQSSNKLNFL